MTQQVPSTAEDTFLELVSSGLGAKAAFSAFGVVILLRLMFWALGRTKELLSEHDKMREVLTQDNENLRSQIRELSKEIDTLRAYMYRMSTHILKLNKRILDLGGELPDDSPLDELSENDKPTKPPRGASASV